MKPVQLFPCGPRLSEAAARWSLAALLLLSVPTLAEPLLTKTNLFHAGEAGYALYRIPGIVVTSKGTILAYCEARKNSRSDWGEIDLLLRRGTENGTHWGAPHKLAEPKVPITRNPVAVAQKLGRPGEITLNNPVAIADQKTGVVHFLYCAEYNRCFYLRSTDDGVTFSDPKEITSTFDQFRPEYGWKVIATGPGHGIQLANGRLLVPIWMSTGTGGHAHRPSAVSIIYSDDAGETWKRGDLVCNHPEPLSNPSETAAAQLRDSRVMLNIRSESKAHRRAVSFSKDGATGWTPLTFQDDLPEPICMGSLVALSNAELLFANPDSVSRARTNLTVYLSRDQGRSWPIKKSLEPGPSAYSDLAVTSDGSPLCLYENNSAEKTLTLARFDISWLTNTVSLSP
jgi:sialidase-1